MKRKNKINITGLTWLIVSAIGISVFFFMITRREKPLSVSSETKTKESYVRIICVNKDTVDFLINNFCAKHSWSRLPIDAGKSKMGFRLGGVGKMHQYFLLKNDSLTVIKNKGFDIEKRPDTLTATFTIIKNGEEECVELPSDVLFALLKEHPKVKK